MHRAAPLVALALLGGCGGRKEVPASAPAVDWRRVATTQDRARLRAWRSAWLDAVGRARAAGSEPAIAAQAPLFDPDAAIGDPIPPGGDYRCRVFKLGARQAGTRDFVAYPAFTCRIDVDGGAVRFRKTAGSQRPVGTIFPATSSRAVFLGTLVLGDEARPIPYGRDATRDMVGVVERIGPRRWRIGLPLPAFESTFDVVELVPTP